MNQRNWWPRGWRGLVLLVAGGVIAVNLLSPAIANIGSVNHLWNQHIKPKADARYLPGGNLPVGATIRGSLLLGASAANGEFVTQSISFGWTLKVPPAAHYIAAGDPPTAECPGTVAAPDALPGNFCFYERIRLAGTGPFLYDPVTNDFNAAGRHGVGVAIVSTGGLTEVDGTWAVTAGTPPAPSGETPRPADGTAGLAAYNG